jgi:ElaB/YqjD/DUF883 family membrane-anchored ribosome-binding protein
MSAAQDVSKEKLVADFKVVVADAEALLKATASQTGEKVVELRNKIEDSLVVAKRKLAEAEAALVDKTKQAAQATDDYVHAHPWKAVGAGVGIGLIIGLLIGRR